MVTTVSVPSPESIKKDVQHLKQWIFKEPHLPNIDDEMWLETFLYSNKFNLEQTKFKLENYYSLRSKYPEILKNRDPTSPEMLKCRKCVKIALSKKLLNDNTWVAFFKCEAKAGDLDVIACAKRVFMTMDMMLLKQKNRALQFIPIVDMRDYGYLHAVKCLEESEKISEIRNNAYTERIQAVHLVNFPSVGSQFREFFLQYIPDELKGRVHIHTASSSTLLETMDREVLCEDLGGNGPSLAELEDRTQQELVKYRKWFEEQDSVCSDETLRVGTIKRWFNSLTTRYLLTTGLLLCVVHQYLLPNFNHWFINY